jgi:hypothetical protein
MQPTIHLERKAGFLPRPDPALRSKCIVGCILNSLGLIITLYIIYFHILSVTYFFLSNNLSTDCIMHSLGMIPLEIEC